MIVVVELPLRAGVRVSDDDAGRFIVGALSVRAENVGVFCTTSRLCSSACSSSFTATNIATSTSRGHLNILFLSGHIF